MHVSRKLQDTLCRRVENITKHLFAGTEATGQTMPLFPEEQREAPIYVMKEICCVLAWKIYKAVASQ